MKASNRGIKTLRFYLLVCGVLAHLLLFSAVAVLVADRLGDHWRVVAVARWLEGEIDDTPVYALAQASSGKFALNELPVGKWVKIHQQTKHDPVQFDRQIHSGSAWDSRRGRLLVFGSDTHGKNWDNSLYYFELRQLRWSQVSQADPVESYSVNEQGLPIAGSTSIKPWAMHTFDALNYDVKGDALVVASHPGHLKPGHFGDWLKDLWPRVQKHPTWVYSFDSQQWRAAPGKAVHFFPYASAYDTDRELVVGFRPDGVFEFRGAEGWVKVAKRSVVAWHTQAVYDDKHNAFVLFGTNAYGNGVHVYRAGDAESVEMPTAGLRPPGASSPPLAYNAKKGKVVALVDTTIDGEEVAQTWLYDVAADEWELAAGASFPFKVGMNYHMQYSQSDDLLVLLAHAAPEPPSVWVLRL